jgi:hypothetical protein
MRLRNLIVLVALALGGCSPPPFNAGTDCPKQPNCGQCASRGGCGWCGDQCMAMGSAACSSAWVSSPDMCTAPPSGTIVP